jgi:hypothetical protein
MLLKTSRATAQGQLLALQTDGHELLNRIRTDYAAKRAAGHFDQLRDICRYQAEVSSWIAKVVRGFEHIFPTNLEAHSFRNAPSKNITYRSGENIGFGSLRNRMLDLIGALDQILTVNLERYTDVPLQDRLYVDDIDSFRRAWDVKPAMVATFLENGYLPHLEDDIQRHFEAILDVPFHQKDWAGEINDLYATNLTVSGQRVATAFLLKGRGLQRRELRIGDCGQNGDQLVRLFESPARLLVVQFVGIIDQMVIKDVEGKVTARTAEGKPTWYAIIDGQDTARILHGYGKL